MSANPNINVPNINVPCLLALLNDQARRFELELLLQENPGGIARLVTSMYFTYDIDGDEVLFSDEHRAAIESALGVKLEEKVYSPNYTLETALAIPEPQRSDFVALLNAWRVNAPVSTR